METELNLQSHGNFTEAEKDSILKALDDCEKEYKQISTVSLLNWPYYHYGNTTDAIGLCTKLNYRLDYLYYNLFSLYHNPKFYIANNLPVKCKVIGTYWWPEDDVESRLKAIELLRKAVKDD